jgi:hypothetical protein
VRSGVKLITAGRYEGGEMKKEDILRKGNASLAIGTLLGLGAISCPCPTCFLSTAAFLLHSIREKISG